MICIHDIKSNEFSVNCNNVIINLDSIGITMVHPRANLISISYLVRQQHYRQLHDTYDYKLLNYFSYGGSDIWSTKYLVQILLGFIVPTTQCTGGENPGYTYRCWWCVDFSHVRLRLARRTYEYLSEFTNDTLHVFSSQCRNQSLSDIVQLKQWFVDQMNRIELLQQ